MQNACNNYLIPLQCKNSKNLIKVSAQIAVHQSITQNVFNVVYLILAHHIYIYIN